MTHPPALPRQLEPLAQAVDRVLLHEVLEETPHSLREPIAYFLKAPGKKIRPLLTLLTAQLVGGRWSDALPAAVAVELFHDFTLIHDDIMDRDSLRRGQPTIHIKWDEGTAILSGDALIGLAFRQLLKSPAHSLVAVTDMFSEALLRVCEGQALDKEFEHRQQIQPEDYLEMINKKTAWLMRTACGMGAVVGGGTPEQVARLARFGELLGLGFQIQDDLLDVVADEATLGKEVGSDFRMAKKTYVVIKLQHWQKARGPAAQLYREMDFPYFRQLLSESGLVNEIEQEVADYFSRALELITSMGRPEQRQPLLDLLQFLRKRTY